MDASALMRALTPERTRFVRFVRPRVESEADAEDLVQRALLHASTRAASVRDPDRARAWFYRILRRAVADHRRARRSNPVRADPEALERHLEQQLEPPTVEVAPSPCTCALRLLGELRPAYAEVLRRVDLEGGDPATVAEALGISTANLHVRLHRARGTLRDRVKHHCGVTSVGPCIDCTCDARRCCTGPRAPSPATRDRTHHGRIRSIRMILDTGPFARAAGTGKEAAVDPVCRMSVRKSEAAATRRHSGRTYYFCNQGCAAAFEQEPQRYAGRATDR